MNLFLFNIPTDRSLVVNISISAQQLQIGNQSKGSSCLCNLMTIHKYFIGIWITMWYFILLFYCLLWSLYHFDQFLDLFPRNFTRDKGQKGEVFDKSYFFSLRSLAGTVFPVMGIVEKSLFVGSSLWAIRSWYFSEVRESGKVACLSFKCLRNTTPKSVAYAIGSPATDGDGRCKHVSDDSRVKDKGYSWLYVLVGVAYLFNVSGSRGEIVFFETLGEEII